MIKPASDTIQMLAHRGPRRPRIYSIGAKSISTMNVGCAIIACRVRSRRVARSSTSSMHTALRGQPDIQIAPRVRRHDTTEKAAILWNKRVTSFWLGCGIAIKPLTPMIIAHGISEALMRDVAGCFGRALPGARLPGFASGTRSSNPVASRPRRRQALLGARLPEQTPKDDLHTRKVCATR